MIGHLITQITSDQYIRLYPPIDYWYISIVQKLQNCVIFTHKQIYNKKYYYIDFKKYRIHISIGPEELCIWLDNGFKPIALTI